MHCAIAGVQPELSGFNGSRPGPELQVRKGDSLKNRVENDLQDGALVHRHGLRVSIRMGGGITSFRPDAALIVDSTSPMRGLTGITRTTSHTNRSVLAGLALLLLMKRAAFRSCLSSSWTPFLGDHRYASA